MTQYFNVICFAFQNDNNASLLIMKMVSPMHLGKVCGKTALCFNFKYYEHLIIYIGETSFPYSVCIDLRV